MSAPAIVKIGISGWSYAPWRGVFYPENCGTNKSCLTLQAFSPQSRLTGRFIHCSRHRVSQNGRARLPMILYFPSRGGRFITHMKRLAGVRKPLANFLASGLLRLGPKLGPILWQLPPDFRFDKNKIEDFLTILPCDTESAAAAARGHDSRLKARAWMRTDAKRPIRYALEVRHESFQTEAFVELLRGARCGTCVRRGCRVAQGSWI